MRLCVLFANPCVLVSGLCFLPFLCLCAYFFFCGFVCLCELVLFCVSELVCVMVFVCVRGCVMCVLFVASRIVLYGLSFVLMCVCVCLSARFR